MPELEIYSDFNCTWCYFDKPSIKKLKLEYDVEILYRAFPLHPDIPVVVPTYIMNGTKLMGSQTYEKLEALMVTNNIPKKN